MPTLNMAAMIDVVFQLNLFFLCTASFVKIEKEMQTQLPQVRTVQVRQEFDPVRIHLGRVPGGVRVTCDSQPCDSFDSLTRMLRERRAIADVPVIIDGDQDVPFQSMVAALDACHRADCRKVAFSARGAG
jgi:biopolymer transport protein ExbD